MSLSDLASIGSFVSAIAVIISLIYVSVQVRQAHRNQQASIRQGRSTRIVNLFIEASNPSVADAVAKGIAGATDISSTQFEQFRYYCMAHISHAEDSFYQHQDGLLNDAAFETFCRRVERLVPFVWYTSSMERNPQCLSERLCRVHGQGLRRSADCPAD